MLIRRRGFLGGLLAGGIVLAAPVVIRTPELLMPVKPPLREVRFWRLSKMYMASPGNEIELPDFVDSLGTKWQRERESAKTYWGEPIEADRTQILAKTMIQVPAGMDLSVLGEGWNVDGASVSRLSRL